MSRDIRPARAVAAFDSASAMLRATTRALCGKDFPHLGQGAARALPVRMSRLLPVEQRRRMYAWSGAAEGVPADRLGDVDLDAIARWVVGQYSQSPDRRYPGVVVGSSNGAAVHLYAATGMAWLPQTVLVPVRWAGNDPDDPQGAMEFGREVAGPLLKRNPHVVLHHMHDGNQDRLMVAGMTYFRLKWTKLPPAYVEFLAGHLEPGAPVVTLEDTSTWPTTTVAERHVFQTGAQGGLDAADYLNGSPRVTAFLHEQGSPRSRFAAPEPDGRSPEAEWGFDPLLGQDVADWAERHGRSHVRVRIPSPQALSGPVARLFRRRIREAGGSGDRMLVESFVMLDPVQAERTASVPYWTFFGVERARQDVLRHLAAAAAAGDPYADVEVLLFPHGVASSGATPPRTWAELSRHVTGTVRLPASTVARWPAHFDALADYGPMLTALPTPARGVSPSPLTVRALLDGLSGEGVDVSGVPDAG
ncbi:hypothetical protein [Actinopolymorpha singaporensis]|uniref:Uncharacterized protein n=1 Tax=Actinopolymorpha singaporensis TaxID=117157 RepID=A0A1H1PIC1_9ACTN|nr:hypothetical protein [Actinopolymorpha singaporensis]SDS11028.1 hypothetical protein SAMN04489717_1655 [Actinopolymorpha singaporensis]